MPKKTDLVSKIMLILATILAILITLSGFLSAQNLVSLIFQFLFLPVTLYLLAATIKLLASHALENSFADKKLAIVIFLIIFGVLLGLQAKRLLTKPAANSEQNLYPKTTIETNNSTNSGMKK